MQLALLVMDTMVHPRSLRAWVMEMICSVSPDTDRATTATLSNRARVFTTPLSGVNGSSMAVAKYPTLHRYRAPYRARMLLLPTPMNRMCPIPRSASTTPSIWAWVAGAASRARKSCRAEISRSATSRLSRSISCLRRTLNSV